MYRVSCALNDMILDTLLNFLILNFNHEMGSFQMERRQTSTKKRKLVKTKWKIFFCEQGHKIVPLAGVHLLLHPEEILFQKSNCFSNLELNP